MSPGFLPALSWPRGSIPIGNVAEWGWSGSAKVLGKLSVLGRPTNFDNSRAGPIALAVGAGGGSLDIFSLVYLFSFLSPSLGDGPI